MSKETEALYRIANANNHFKYDTLELMEKDFQIVNQGLLRLEAIEKRVNRMKLLSLCKCLSQEEHIVIIDDIYYLRDKIVYEGTIVTIPKQYLNREVFQIMPYDNGCMYVMICEEGVSYDYD